MTAISLILIHFLLIPFSPARSQIGAGLKPGDYRPVSTSAAIFFISLSHITGLVSSASIPASIALSTSLKRLCAVSAIIGMADVCRFPSGAKDAYGIRSHSLPTWHERCGYSGNDHDRQCRHEDAGIARAYVVEQIAHQPGGKPGCAHAEDGS